MGQVKRLRNNGTHTCMVRFVSVAYVRAETSFPQKNQKKLKVRYDSHMNGAQSGGPHMHMVSI